MRLVKKYCGKHMLLDPKPGYSSGGGGGNVTGGQNPPNSSPRRRRASKETKSAGCSKQQQQQQQQSVASSSQSAALGRWNRTKKEAFDCGYGQYWTRDILPPPSLAGEQDWANMSSPSSRKRLLALLLLLADTKVYRTSQRFPSTTIFSRPLAIRTLATEHSRRQLD
jgi:hypothetical protein